MSETLGADSFIATVSPWIGMAISALGQIVIMEPQSPVIAGS